MFNLSMEMIDYQIKDSTHSKLTSIISEIYEEIDKNTYTGNKELLNKSQKAKDVLTLMTNRFGLMVYYSSVMSDEFPAAVIPSLSNEANNVNTGSPSGFKLADMLKSFNVVSYMKEVERIVKEREKDYREASDKKGTINRKLARVTGYFTSMKHYLLINYYALKSLGVSPAELSAVILHEIGHAFTGLETHHKLASTNATILDIISDINKNKQDVAVHKFKKKFTKADIDEAAMGKSEHLVDFYSAIVKSYMHELDSQILNNKYNETTFENMADSFAVRLGAGADIATALEKLMGLTKTNYVINLSVSIFLNALFFILLVSLLSPVPAMGLVMFSLFVDISYNNSAHMTYDFPKERYERVRLGIVNGAKNLSLTDREAKEMLSQIETLDAVIANTYELAQTYKYIAEYVSPTSYNNTYYRNIQRITERVLSNDLFVSRWKLKVS